MKIDVDKLKWVVNGIATHDMSPAEAEAIDHLIALARVGAAAVEERRIHEDASIPDLDWDEAKETLDKAADEYLATHPEGAQQ